MAKILPKRLENSIVRYRDNPIITTKDIPFACAFVFNAGAIKYKNKYLLLLRIQDMKLQSHLLLAESEDGIHFRIHNKYFLSPDEKLEEMGVEDPRITALEDKFYITYTAYSRYGTCVGLIETKDFVRSKKLGIILPPDNKDAVLLPEKVRNKYFLYHRPTSSKSIWVSSSPDLIYWGEHNVVMSPDNLSWDSEKIGPGAVPIKTPKGWLHIYHGVGFGSYRLGLALFDLNKPEKLIRKSDSYILSPEEPYERIGGVSNVVFSCGAIVEEDGEVKIYYGAADTSICLATAKLQDLLEIAERY